MAGMHEMYKTIVLKWLKMCDVLLSAVSETRKGSKRINMSRLPMCVSKRLSPMVGILLTGTATFAQNQSALLDASIRGDGGRVKSLLPQGVEINQAIRSGIAPLMLESCFAHQDVLDDLLAEGPAVSALTAPQSERPK
jgi:hypothetical protein